MHKTFCILTDYYNYTHAFSGSMNQSPSHSHPLGGMKYSCFSFSLPVTSENLWRPTSPVVPHFPNTWAWFSYCDANRTTRFVLLNADFTAGLWRTFNHFGNIEKILFYFFFPLWEMIYQLSEHAEGSLREGVELLLVCRQTQPHVDSSLNGHLQALGLVQRVLSKQKNKRKRVIEQHLLAPTAKYKI